MAVASAKAEVRSFAVNERTVEVTLLTCTVLRSVMSVVPGGRLPIAPFRTGSLPATTTSVAMFGVFCGSTTRVLAVSIDG